MKPLLFSWALIPCLLAQSSIAKHISHGHKHVVRSQSLSLPDVRNSEAIPQSTTGLYPSDELYLDGKYQDLLDEDDVTNEPTTSTITPTITPTLTITVSATEAPRPTIAQPLLEEDDSDDEARDAPTLKRRFAFQSAVKRWGKALALPRQFLATSLTSNILEARQNGPDKAPLSDDEPVSAESDGSSRYPSTTTHPVQIPISTASNSIDNASDSEDDYSDDDDDYTNDESDLDVDADALDTLDDSAGYSDDASSFVDMKDGSNAYNDDESYTDTGNGILTEIESVSAKGFGRDKRSQSTSVANNANSWAVSSTPSLASFATTVAVTSTSGELYLPTTKSQDDNGDISNDSETDYDTSEPGNVAAMEADTDSDSQSDEESDDGSDDDSEGSEANTEADDVVEEDAESKA